MSVPVMSELSTLRASHIANLLGPLKGKRVLVIGIGGGGDVVGALPVCFDLERIGASVLIAGLAWKRLPHDPAGRPRGVDEFEGLLKINACIGLVNGGTRLRHGGPIHIEALVAGALGREVFTIDITGGVAAVRAALGNLQEQARIDAVLGIDVGGDVLCKGSESTVRSPLCDQVMLAALGGIEGSILGVAGIGCDGELGHKDLFARLEELYDSGGYLGGVTFALEDLSRIGEMLKAAPTESSALMLSEALNLTKDQLLSIETRLCTSRDSLLSLTVPFKTLPLRGGTRQAEIGSLTAATLFFEPGIVYRGTDFIGLMDPKASVAELHQSFTNAGIVTEFSDSGR